MKKNLLIVIAVLLVLLLAGLFFTKALNNKQEESMPDIEQVGTVQENIMDTEENISSETSEKGSVTKVPETKIPSENIIKRAVKKVQSKLSHEEETVKERETVTELQAPVRAVDYTPEADEEKELLKKIPRTEEVVVDKEIKSKSSNKYIFK